MPKPKRSPRPTRRQPAKPSPRHADPPEDRAAEAITIAWTVSVTAVFMADLVTIAAHFYALAHPESKTAAAFAAIILLSACVMGVASLALLPVVWRVRRVRPPIGFAVFAGSVAAAPVLALAFRLWA